jgi:BON domain-containing protein
MRSPRSRLRPRTLLALASAFGIFSTAAEEPRTYQLDPFAQATTGYAACPAASPPVLTEQEMRATAHQRVERGTSCCLAGTCECGGAYKRDPEINERVVAAIRNDRRFRDTSVWVTTTRKFVTLEGCVRSAAQKNALGRLAKRQRDVAIVWNEMTVGVKSKKKP